MATIVLLAPTVLTDGTFTREGVLANPLPSAVVTLTAQSTGLPGDPCSILVEFYDSADGVDWQSRGTFSYSGDVPSVDVAAGTDEAPYDDVQKHVRLDVTVTGSITLSATATI
jgi:hypothetical protein